MDPIKVLSWNVEHFKGKSGARVDRVVNLVKSEDPDVFSLSEVEGKTIFYKMANKFPGYNFHITEGRQTQELLVGVKGGLTSFFTQRDEFRRGKLSLRPGALLTVTPEPNTHIPILFTHLKSMPDPEGFGLRDAMFKKAFELKKALDKAARKNGHDASNLIITGDMNTMGMNYVGRNKDISGVEELRNISKSFNRRGMVTLSKDHDATFNNGSNSSYAPANLDHVMAAKHLDFATHASGAQVHVGGWADKNTTASRDKWIKDYSDHAPLTFTITGV